MSAADPAAAIRAVVHAAGGRDIDPPTLVPARLLLDLSGEAVRSRLCTFTDAEGREYCLRPDMTTPIARLVAEGAAAPDRYRYDAPVYRQPADGDDGGIEFRQIGFEWFDAAPCDPSTDADAIALALEAAAAAGVRSAVLRVGDVSLYRGVVDALGFPDAWSDRLKRAFARSKGPREWLRSADRPAGDDVSLAALGEVLAAIPGEAAERALGELLGLAGAEAAGGRPPGEIIDRLRTKAAATAIDRGAGAALVRYLDIDVPVERAEAELDGWLRASGVRPPGAAARLLATFGRLTERRPPLWDAARFRPETGRRFDYYDGVVFELTGAPPGSRPILGGGRYDGLLARLSDGRVQADAIGVAIRPDRAARGCK